MTRTKRIRKYEVPRLLSHMQYLMNRCEGLSKHDRVVLREWRKMALRQRRPHRDRLFRELAYWKWLIHARMLTVRV